MTLAALEANAAARAEDRVSSVDPAAYLEAQGVTARVDAVITGMGANDGVAPVNDVAAPRARVLMKRRERAVRRANRAI